MSGEQYVKSITMESIEGLLTELRAETGQDILLLGSYNTMVSANGKRMSVTALLLLNREEDEIAEVALLPGGDVSMHAVPMEFIRNMPVELLGLAALVTGSGIGQALASIYPVFAQAEQAPIGADAVVYDHNLLIRVLLPGVDMQDIWYAGCYGMYCFPSAHMGIMPTQAEAILTVKDFKEFGAMPGADCQEIYKALTSEQGLSAGGHFTLKIARIMHDGAGDTDDTGDTDADMNQADVN